MWIVVTGNPVDGIAFSGPFTTAEAANNWADDALPNTAEWWVAYVQKVPEESR